MALTKLPGFTLDTSSNVTFANANVSGNLTSSNANLGNLAVANYYSGNGSLLTSLTGANVAGFVPNANIANTAYAVAGANVSGQVSNALIAGTVYTNAQPNITSVGTLTGLTVNGNSTINNVSLTGNIIPSVTNTYALGNATHYFKDAFIGPGSLYVNGKKVLEEVSGTINFTTDINQNLKVSTSGSGDILFDPTGTGVISIKGPLQIEAGINVTSSDGNSIHLANPLSVDSITTHLANTDLSISANGTGTIRLNDDVIVSGNLTVSGTTTYINTETVQLYDNIIDLNSNFTTGSPTENAGVRVLRGDEAAVSVRWNEATDKWQYTTDGSAYVDIVGTTSLGVTSLGNSATANYFTGNGSLLTSITGSNVSGNVTSAVQAHYANIANSVAVANVTGIGNIATINKDGNVSNILYGNGVFAAAPAGGGGGGGGGTTTNALTIGTGLSGTSFNGSSAVTIAIDSTVATLTGSQTLTNKILTSPTIDSGTSNNSILIGTLTANGSAGTNGQFLQSTATGVKWANVPDISVIAITDETSNITVSSSRMSFRAPKAMQLSSIPRASLVTASTSGLVTCDIKLNGTSILGVNKLSIDANESTSVTAATATTLVTTSIPDDGLITIDITSAGTGAKGLKITFYS